MDIFVLRGSREELEEMGMNSLIEKSDLLIELPSSGPVKDSAGQEHNVSSMVIDPSDLALIDCLKQIKEAWERTHPEEAHLGHAASGLWFFYWFSPEMDSMDKLVARGDSKALRASANDYIASLFGAQRGPTLNLAQ